MTVLTSALSRLQATALAPFGNRLDRLLDAEAALADLHATLLMLKAGQDAKVRISPATIAMAKAQWLASKGSLSILTRRQIRALCDDIGISTSPAFVAALAQSDEFPERRRWIESLIGNYFSAWRPSEPAVLEALLQRVVHDFKGKSPRIASCRPVAKDLFSARAACWLGDQVVERRHPWQVILGEWGVERSGRLAEATANASVDAWLKHFAIARGTWTATTAQPELTFVLETLLEPQVVTLEQFSRAISQVILWPAIDKDDDLVERVRTYVLKHPRLGDPRHKAGNWSSCDPAAVRKARAWFARFDLEFFFKFVIHNDPHGRKAFWLDYIDRVEMSNVALCDADAQRLRAHSSECPRYSRSLGGGNVSAFFMRFPGSSVIFVEFSQPGNALYCHDAARFEAHAKGGITQATLHFNEELKNQWTKRLKITHRDGWQYEVRNLLASLGIRP